MFGLPTPLSNMLLSSGLEMTLLRSLFLIQIYLQAIKRKTCNKLLLRLRSHSDKRNERKKKLLTKNEKRMPMTKMQMREKRMAVETMTRKEDLQRSPRKRKKRSKRTSRGISKK